MAMTPALKTQIAAIQSRLNTVAETATPEDLVMLAKAVEAVGGQATVFDIITTGEEQQTKLFAIKGEVEALASRSKADITAAKEASIEEISRHASDLKQLQSLALMF